MTPESTQLDDETPATRWLAERGVAFTRHEYHYEERGGARHAAECIGVAPGLVVKTLVMRADARTRVLVLMHGDRQVDTKRLARAIGARSVHSATPAEALEVTGYLVGGISPFGTAEELPIVVEATILDSPRIWINGGRRGLLLGIESAVLRETLGVQAVSVAA